MTEAELTPLATQLATIQDQIKQLTEQADTIKARIIDLCDGDDLYAAGNLTIRISTTRRLNTEAFAKAHPIDKHPEMYKIAIDTTLARANTTPAIYETFMTKGATQVRLI